MVTITGTCLGFLVCLLVFFISLLLAIILWDEKGWESVAIPSGVVAIASAVFVLGLGFNLVREMPDRGYTRHCTEWKDGLCQTYVETKDRGTF